MNMNQNLILSFEFFPPKTNEGFESLLKTADNLAKCNPHFFSVTFGAGGSTREGTLEAVLKLQSLGVETAPHIACVGLERSELISIINTYKEMNIKRLVVLRGDLPSGMGRQNGELQFSFELVQLIRDISGDFFHIEVAAYPEVHPQAINGKADLLNLKKKMDAGANSAITQYFFNADGYFHFIDQCIRHNITIPIVPGIMPITNYAKLVRFSDLCGAEIPRWIRKRLEYYADDRSSIEAFGLEVVSNLCSRLIDGGVSGLHFYTLNRSDASLLILEQLKI